MTEPYLKSGYHTLRVLDVEYKISRTGRKYGKARFEVVKSKTMEVGAGCIHAGVCAKESFTMDWSDAFQKLECFVGKEIRAHVSEVRTHLHGVSVCLPTFIFPHTGAH